MSRFHVRVERYVKNLMIEVDTLRSMVDTQVLPSSFAYHGVLAQAVASAKAAGLKHTPQAPAADKLGTLIQTLITKRADLEAAWHKVETLHNEEEKAKLLSRDVSNAMLETRVVCDELESVVADDYWPLPKYREMLFMS